jgi:uncharacterized protein YdaU (DUF1376 family)
MKGPAYIRYSPGDMLDGVQFLSPWEELAYRRICDLIYKTGDHLEGDDRKLAKMTKTGNRWLRIKAVLIADEKLFVTGDGRISNVRCQQELQKTEEFFRQKTVSGRASMATGKSLKNLKRGPNDLRTGLRTNFLTSQSTPPIVPPKGDDSKNELGRKAAPGLPPLPPWEQRCRAWVESGFWNEFWGPPPSELGCHAPDALAAEARQLRNGEAR